MSAAPTTTNRGAEATCPEYGTRRETHTTVSAYKWLKAHTCQVVAAS